MKKHVKVFFETIIPFFEHLPGNWAFRSDEERYDFLVKNLPTEKINKEKDALVEYFTNKYGTEFSFCFLEFNVVDSEKYNRYLNLINSLRFEVTNYVQ